MDLLDVLITLLKVIFKICCIKITDIEGFPIFIGYFPIALIIVYKIRHYNYRRNPELPEKYLESNGGLDNAEYRTKRKILDEYVHSDFHTEQDEDKHGSFWRIIVKNLFFTDTFVPTEEDDDSYLTKKQKEKYK